MLPLFQGNFILGKATSSHSFRVTTSTQQLLFRSSYFFITAAFSPFSEQSLFARVFFFRNNFLFGGKLLPSHNTILRITVPCYNLCKKNKESKKQSFRICVLVIMCLSWWININKRGRNLFVPCLKYCQFGQNGWKSRTFFMRISWTCLNDVKYSICLSLDFEYRLRVIIFTQERAPRQTFTYLKSTIFRVKMIL